MKKLYLLLAVLLPVLMTGCASVSVHTDSDPRVNLAHYRTFALAPSKETSWSPSTVAVIETSLASGLQAKGYVQTSHPGFYVSYHIVRRERTQVSSITTGSAVYRPGGYFYNDYPYYGGYYGFWPGYTQTYTTVTPYEEGTLIVDFIDSKTHEAVWRGTASAVVADRYTNQSNLQTGIQKMLSEFPSRP